MDELLLKTIYWNNVNIIECINQTLKYARIHDQGGVWPSVSRISSLLSENLSLIAQLEQQMDIQVADHILLLPVLQVLYEAQQQKDYILMGDYYEGQLIPILYQIQTAIYSICEEPLYPREWYECNLNIIRNLDQNLYNELQTIADDHSEQIYRPEPSSTGAYTIAIEEQKSRYYLHSNVDPKKEAAEFAERFYRVEHERYLILGLGLGYHLQELHRLCEDIELIVAEPDIRMIYYACICNDLSQILPNIRFLYGDTIWADFQQVMSRKPKLVIYPPSIRHIQESNVRQRFDDLINRDNGILRHQRVFSQNFRSNLQHCEGYVDEICEDIQGRHVVIVAGGPSLDRNVNALVKDHSNLKILSVGTVYSKLLRIGIHPDYVVASDVNAYHQFENNLTESVPILLLSTADRKIARNYQGKKYLVCQKGYEQAAEYASQKGWNLYDSGGSVTTLALDLAIRMKAASIALIGLDLAYDGERFHASDTRDEKTNAVGDHVVTGIHGEQLRTSYNFIQYKEWIEERLQEDDVTMNVYDASEGGARIEQTKMIALTEYLSTRKDEQ